MVPKGWILEPIEIRKGSQNHVFNIKKNVGAKSALREGFRKKHKKYRKMGRKTIDFWVPETSWTTFPLQRFFTIFETSRKINAKRNPQKSCFGSKIDPWASEGRLLGRSGNSLGELENHRFFDVALGVEKSIKIDPSWSKS